MSLRDETALLYPVEQRIQPIFIGNLSAYAKLIITNFLLTIVTLGVYSFWARRNLNRYFWANTSIDGEPLEFTGTVKEIFIGTLLALLLLGAPAAILAFMVQIDESNVIFTPLFALYALFLISYASHAGLNCILSRTLWRGMRGGLEGSALGFAWRATLYMLAAIFTAGILYPMMLAKKWNLLWNSASFGSEKFSANMKSDPIYVRYFFLLGSSL